ncbi:hypothetical protein ACP3VW_09730 [Vibrio sp. DNB22_17_1]
MRIALKNQTASWYKELSSAYRHGDMAKMAHFYELIKTKIGSVRAHQLSHLFSCVQHDRKWQAMADQQMGYFTYTKFVMQTTSKFRTMKLWLAINRNNETIKIRKQDEAPKAGADSSQVSAEV